MCSRQTAGSTPRVAAAPGTACARDRLFTEADAALYAAEDSGRNQVRGQAPATPALRLLVAGDDATIRLTLGADWPPGGHAAGRRGARRGRGRAARAPGRPDVVPLDVDMPGGGEIRAATEIRQALPDVRVVAIGGDDSQLNEYEMLRAGAVGFLANGAPDEEILRVIRSSARW